MYLLFLIFMAPHDAGGIGSYTLKFPDRDSCEEYAENLDPTWNGGMFTADPDIRWTCVPDPDAYAAGLE